MLSLVESLRKRPYSRARHYDMTLTSCARDKISMASGPDGRPTPPKKKWKQGLLSFPIGGNDNKQVLQSTDQGMYNLFI